MKKLLITTGLVFLACAAFASRITTYTPQVDPATTNTILVDTRGITGLSVTASGTGTAWYYASVAITSNPNTNGTQPKPPMQPQQPARTQTTTCANR